MKKKSYIFGSNSRDAFQKIKQAYVSGTGFIIENPERLETQLQAVGRVYTSIQRARQVDERIAATPVSV